MIVTVLNDIYVYAHAPVILSSLRYDRTRQVWAGVLIKCYILTGGASMGFPEKLILIQFPCCRSGSETWGEQVGPEGV